MTTDTEARTRAALRALAAAIDPQAPAFDALLTRRASPVGPAAGRRVPWRIRAGGAVAAAAAVAAIVLVSREPAAHAPAPPGPAVSASPHPTSPATATSPPATATAPPSDPPRTVASIQTSAARGRLTFAFGKVWQAGTNDNSLVAVDPATREIVSTFEGMPGPYLTAGDDSLYVCGFQGVVRIDPTTGETLATSERGCFVSIAFGAGSVWVSDQSGGLIRLDASTLEEQAVLPDVTARWGITYAFGSVWVADGTGHDADQRGHVTRIDPATNAVAAVVSTPGMARLFAVADGSLWLTTWVTSGDRLMLVRIDPATNTISATVAGQESTEVVAVDDLLVVSAYGGLIRIVDPRTLEVLTQFNPQPTGPFGDRTAIAWDGQVLWQRLPNADGAGHGALLAIDLGEFAPAG